MRVEQFNEVFRDTVNKSSSVLVKKAEEYADDVDRLRNFKQAAHLEGITPIKALEGMMAKHTVSVYDMMGSGLRYTRDDWDEKIIDHINYLILLRALVVEDIEGES
jgi:hypothetical protein